MSQHHPIKNFFLRFSGEDFQIINKSKTSLTFLGIGVFVFVIFVLCCVSGFSFLYNSFQGNIFLSAPIGVFWGLLIAVIYVFLIYTITPILLPTPIKKKNKIIGEVKPLVFNYNTSFFLRYGFIIFISLIVAQPLNVFLLKEYSNRSVERYKIEYKLSDVLSADSVFVKKETEYRSKFQERMKTLNVHDSISLNLSNNIINQKVYNDNETLINGTSYKNNLEKLKKLSFSEKNQQKFDDLYVNIENLLNDESNDDEAFLENIKKIKFDNEFLQNDFEEYKESIVTIIQDKKTHSDQLKNLVDKSNFYVTTMKIILKENPVSWIITFITIIIFSLPLYFKYRVAKESHFFNIKQRIELDFVENNYSKHLTQYGLKLEKTLEKLNQELISNLSTEMQKLEGYDAAKHQLLLAEMKKEVADVFIEKFQFWKNPPFRTKKIENNIVHKSQKDFLEFIYQSK